MLKNKSFKTFIPRTAYPMALVALFVSLIIVGAFIKIPFPVVPITLQTLFVLMAGMVLGYKLAGVAIGLYIFMGLVGLPVFTSGGGLTYILLPKFGFLLGFLIAGIVVGFLTVKSQNCTVIKMWVFGLIGIVIIYVCGISYMLIILKYYLHNPDPLASVLTVQFAVLIVGDIFKSLVAALVAFKLRNILLKSSYFRNSVAVS